MAVDIFQSVNWGEEEVTPAKLNAMASNDEFLHQMMPKVRYSGYSLHRDTNLKIASGTVVYSASPTLQVQYLRVLFGDFFTVNCKPVIVTGINSAHNWRMHTSIYGLPGPSTVPGHDGFRVRLTTNERADKVNNFHKAGYVHWIAVGY